MKRINLLLLIIIASIAALEAQIRDISKNNQFLNVVRKAESGFSYKVREHMVYKVSRTDLANFGIQAPVQSNDESASINILSVQKSAVVIGMNQGNEDQFYFSNNAGKNWVSIPNSPNGNKAVFEYFDEQASKVYFQVNPNDVNYVYDLNSNHWDSINNDNAQVGILQLINGEGYVMVYSNASNRNGMMAFTSNGAVSYNILKDINYELPPFSAENNGVLEGITIVNDLFWCAQYWNENEGVQNHKVYYSNDHGKSWKVLVNSKVSGIVAAGNESAYIYAAKGNMAGGSLYKASQNGNNLCPSNFNGNIKSIAVNGNKEGVILVSDVKNANESAWQIVNGGDFKCESAVEAQPSLQVEKSVVKIEVYPNPASDRINISSEKDCSFSVVNMMGEVLFAGQIAQNQFSLDVSGYEAGMYFVKVGAESIKWVKKN